MFKPTWTRSAQKKMTYSFVTSGQTFAQPWRTVLCRPTCSCLTRFQIKEPSSVKAFEMVWASVLSLTFPGKLQEVPLGQPHTACHCWFTKCFFKIQTKGQHNLYSLPWHHRRHMCSPAALKRRQLLANKHIVSICPPGACKWLGHSQRNVNL